MNLSSKSLRPLTMYYFFLTFSTLNVYGSPSTHALISESFYIPCIGVLEILYFELKKLVEFEL